jgi:alpha-amylase
MKNIGLIFQVHHPFHLQTFRYFDIGSSKSYYDDYRIEKELTDAISNYYYPTNKFLTKLIKLFNEKLKFSFYVSGTTLDQFLMYKPEILQSFRQMADSGQVEFAGGTNSHSIAGLSSNLSEFKSQIKQNKERIRFYFGQDPNLFINSDLLFTNQIAPIVSDENYALILTNGADKILQWRSPNYMYSCSGQSNLGLLFRNDKISNDFNFIVQNAKSNEEKMVIDGFIKSLKMVDQSEPILTIYINYMALGGKDRNAKQRIFQKLVAGIIDDPEFCFTAPSDLKEQFGPVTELDVNEPVCWTEKFHPSYFPGNDLQKDAIFQLFKFGKAVHKTTNPNLKMDWKYLQTSNHFHLMDENHPAYRNSGITQENFKSKYDAYINYMNILEDFGQRLKAERKMEKTKKIQQNKNADQFSKPNI